MKVQWKEVPGFNKRYQVSSEGQLSKILKKGNRRILNLTESRGYYYGSIVNDKGIYKRCLISRLIMSAFIGPSDLEVNHINKDKSDNRLVNLEYVTPRENTNHSKEKDKTHSIYRGVTKIGSSWIAQIYIKGKKKYLGCFKDELEASKAYQNELLVNNLQTKYYD